MTFTNEEVVTKLKGKVFPVLDDGFVKLMDCMGDEATIIQSARVSYNGDLRPDEPEKDKALLQFLMDKQHLTPLEMCELRFQCKVPMYIWRQWVRHRTATIMEMSARYTEATDSMQFTKTTQWRKQKPDEESAFLSEKDGIILSAEERDFLYKAREIYEHRLAMGVSKEQARKDLPLSTYTLAYWKIDLRNLLHFLSLRLDKSAQIEIREYATVILGIVAPLFPNIIEAFINAPACCSEETKDRVTEYLESNSL